MTTKEIIARLRQLPIFAREPGLKFKRIRKSKFPSYYEYQFSDFEPNLRIADVFLDTWAHNKMIEPGYDENYILDSATVRIFHSVNEQCREITVFCDENDENIVAILIDSQ